MKFSSLWRSHARRFCLALCSVGALVASSSDDVRGQTPSNRIIVFVQPIGHGPVIQASQTETVVPRQEFTAIEGADSYVEVPAPVMGGYVQHPQCQVPQAKKHCQAPHCQAHCGGHTHQKCAPKKHCHDVPYIPRHSLVGCLCKKLKAMKGYGKKGHGCGQKLHVQSCVQQPAVDHCQKCPTQKGCHVCPAQKQPVQKGSACQKQTCGCEQKCIAQKPMKSCQKGGCTKSKGCMLKKLLFGKGHGHSKCDCGHYGGGVSYSNGTVIDDAVIDSTDERDAETVPDPPAIPEA